MPPKGEDDSCDVPPGVTLCPHRVPYGDGSRQRTRKAFCIDRLRQILLNESFASTNQREGAEIASGIIKALRDAGVRIFYVSHMVDLARAFHRENARGTLFLRAQRLPDGSRTFRLEQADPEPTSHAADLYSHVFQPSVNQEKLI